MTRKTAQAVVIGASAGAFDSLSGILPALPENFPLPIIVVVHMPPDQKSVLNELFQQRCKLQVKEAEDKETLRPGTVYFSPPDYHLLVEQDRRLSLSNEEPVLHSRPSIDVLFETAADAFEEGLIGIVLSGANEDGSRGLKAIIEAGGVGLVQRPDLAYASTMPAAALETSAAAQALTLEQIVMHLQEAATP